MEEWEHTYYYEILLLLVTLVAGAVGALTNKVFEWKNREELRKKLHEYIIREIKFNISRVEHNINELYQIRNKYALSERMIEATTAIGRSESSVILNYLISQGMVYEFLTDKQMVLMHNFILNFASTTDLFFKRFTELKETNPNKQDATAFLDHFIDEYNHYKKDLEDLLRELA